eukprot:Selendium_serpulae@DN6086_c15_g1_i5.p1
MMAAPAAYTAQQWQMLIIWERKPINHFMDFEVTNHFMAASIDVFQSFWKYTCQYSKNRTFFNVSLFQIPEIGKVIYVSGNCNVKHYFFDFVIHPMYSALI